MRFYKKVLAALLFSVLIVTNVVAHDEYRIVGTVTKADKTQVQVTTAQRKTYKVKLDSQTLISRDKKKVSVAELKAGATVVVDALGDSEADLLAVEIRLVPPISK
jgi:hypothetical protein